MLPELSKQQKRYQIYVMLLTYADHSFLGAIKSIIDKNICPPEEDRAFIRACRKNIEPEKEIIIDILLGKYITPPLEWKEIFLINQIKESLDVAIEGLGPNAFSHQEGD
jgi:hypothetical protein